MKHRRLRCAVHYSKLIYAEHETFPDRPDLELYPCPRGRHFHIRNKITRRQKKNANRKQKRESSNVTND